jgi:NAD(P)-dependent dehydrogenase (short-subunit alcohol dehydrogenase family)
MTILVVGATGATGRLLVEELLNRGHFLKVIVRSRGRLPSNVADHANLSVIEADILELSETELAGHLGECQAVASCLGHNLTFKGVFGHPRRLVTDATRRLCTAIRENKPAKPVKFVLMNTSGNSNRDLNEPTSFGHKLVLMLIRLLIPPHSDNEQAADYIRTNIGQNNKEIEWTAVRPDSLTDEENVSEYDVHPSPIRDAIFDSGKISRINVAHFMADLITNEDIWSRWKGQMPVIYNAEKNTAGSK